MIYSCRGMVWGVDCVHLVWVRVGIKKPGGSWIWTKCIFDTISAIQKGQGQGLRDWAR